MKTHQQLRSYFEGQRVPCLKPGFFDDPAFIKLESTNPSILDDYARFVRSRPMLPGELELARKVVPHASAFLFRRLEEEGRLGACIDASLAMSRFLELQGVWNYVVKGGLTVTYDKASGLGPAYLGALMLEENPASAGHVWVCAPPFGVVDVTASLQPYPDEGRQVIGSVCIVEESGEPAVAEVRDILEPAAVAHFRRNVGRDPSMDDVRDYVADLDEKLAEWGTVVVTSKRASFKYVALATSAPTEPLEAMTNLTLAGRSLSELYAEFVAELASLL